MSPLLGLCLLEHTDEVRHADAARLFRVHGGEGSAARLVGGRRIELAVLAPVRLQRDDAILIPAMRQRPELALPVDLAGAELDAHGLSPASDGVLGVGVDDMRLDCEPTIGIRVNAVMSEHLVGRVPDDAEAWVVDLGNELRRQLGGAADGGELVLQPEPDAGMAVE